MGGRTVRVKSNLGRMLGTLYNVVTVAVGSSDRLVLGRRVSDGMRQAVFSALGLFTLFIGIDMMLGITRPMAAFMALVLGAVVGQAIGLDARVRRTADRLRRRRRRRPRPVHPVVLRGRHDVGRLHAGRPSRSRLVLMAKGTMDLFSSIFLAAAPRTGVLWSTGTVLVIQGGLTRAFAAAGAGIPESLITELSGVGGVLLVALGLTCSTSGKFPLLDLTWSLPLLPFILDPARRPVPLRLTHARQQVRPAPLPHHRPVSDQISMRPYPTKEDLRQACEEGLYGSEGNTSASPPSRRTCGQCAMKTSWAITRPSSTMQNTAATNTRTPTTASAASTCRNRTSRPSGLPP